MCYMILSARKDTKYITINNDHLIFNDALHYLITSLLIVLNRLISLYNTTYQWVTHHILIIQM